MRRILGYACLLTTLLVVAFSISPTISAQETFIELWDIPINVNDIAVSEDSRYIVVACYQEILYFSSSSPNPKWTFSAPADFLSIAISSDGENVVTGTDSGALIYFSGSTQRAGSYDLTEYTWSSVILGGPIERRTLAMSDNGGQVAVGGTGENMYYFNDCTSRTGTGQSWTWMEGDIMLDIFAVDMSSNGKYVAAGGRFDVEGNIHFYKDAYSGFSDSWVSTTDLPIQDISVSDDGFAVAAVTPGSSLYYWADALGLSGTPSSRWASYQPFGCVDISSDGNELVTGTLPLTPCGVHFWSNARGRPGPFEDETWTRHEGEFIMDIAISNDGSVIAASSVVSGDIQHYKMYFFNYNGISLGEFELDSPAFDVSMSGDGSIVVAGGGGDRTLYVFKLPRERPVGGTLVSSPSINLLAFIGVSATILTVLTVKLRRR